MEKNEYIVRKRGTKTIVNEQCMPPNRRSLNNAIANLTQTETSKHCLKKYQLRHTTWSNSGSIRSTLQTTKQSDSQSIAGTRNSATEQSRETHGPRQQSQPDKSILLIDACVRERQCQNSHGLPHSLLRHSCNLPRDDCRATAQRDSTHFARQGPLHPSYNHLPGFDVAIGPHVNDHY